MSFAIEFNFFMSLEGKHSFFYFLASEGFASVAVSKMMIWAFFQQPEVDRRFTEILNPKIRELFASQKRFIGFLKAVNKLKDKDIFINASSEQVNVRERMKRIGVVSGLGK